MGANGTTRAAGGDTLSRQTSTLGSSRPSLLGGVLLHDNPRLPVSRSKPALIISRHLHRFLAFPGHRLCLIHLCFPARTWHTVGVDKCFLS